MAITVREIVEDIIMNMEESEIEVDTIENINNENKDIGEMDRIDIVKALQNMEENGLGVFMRGRRGKNSRFVKGMKRSKNEVNKNSLDSLRAEIEKLENGDAMLVSYTDCEDKATEEQILELESFKDKPYASQYFNNNTMNAVEALKVLQKEGLGSFVIGRRGKFSRFIKGVSKDELHTRPKGLVPIEESIIEKKDPKYNIVNNIILRTYDDGKFNSIEDAVSNSDLDSDKINEIKNSILKLGYYVEIN